MRPHMSALSPAALLLAVGIAAPAGAAPDAGAAAKAVPPAAQPAAAPKLALPALVAKIQRRYDETRDLRVRFSQTLTTTVTNRTKKRTGEIVIKKPGKIRMSYDAPEPTMYLTTGQTAWQYEPEDKQAIRSNVKSSQIPAAVSFLAGKGKLSEEFDIAFATDTRYGGPNDYKLSLRPKKPQSTYKAILFIVDPTTFLVTGSVLERAGDTNAFVFSDIKTNTNVPEELFRWTPPSGTRVVDMAGMKPQEAPPTLTAPGGRPK